MITKKNIAVISLALATCGSTVSAQTVLFEDDFIDGTYNKWATYYGDIPSAAVFSVRDGAFLIECNTWCGDARAAVGIGTNWADYSIDLDFNMISGAGNASILFRLRSIGNGCDVGQYDQIYIGQNEVGLTQIDNSGGHGSPEAWTTVSLSTGQWYHFRLVVIGSSAVVFIGQQEVLSFSGLRYPYGGIGLKTINEGNANLFDNVVVSAIGGPCVETTRYVWRDSPNPSPPYTNWATAAHDIQAAVDAAAPCDEIVVTNGIYAAGGRAVVGTMTNRVAVDKPLTLRSVNGPQFTIIQGYQVPGTTNGDGAIRCVYLTNGASLSGFTLTNGATRADGDWEHEQNGGGMWCESATAVVSNCAIADNSAASYGGGACRGSLENCIVTGNSAAVGGGVAGSVGNTCQLKNCTLTGNSARGAAGGAALSTLDNCVLSGNSASLGGGAGASTLNNCTVTGNSAAERAGGVAYGCCPVPSILNNCIVYFNTAPDGANYLGAGLNYSCTTPLPSDGVGNVTNAPLFLDYASGNLRLQSNSPCINAGNNSYMTNSVDLDGRPRIVGGTVDIGAYEFQPGVSGSFIAWLQQYGLPTDGSADATDPDADGHTTWQEWRCLTDPTKALSALRLLTALPAGTNVTVSWQSVAGVSYFLERCTNLASPLLFTPLATGIPGQPGTTIFTDTNAAVAPHLFYRVGVGN